MSQMPMAENPPTKPDGKPYTEDDRQYWELKETHLPDNIRGVRQHRYFPYPRMLYKAVKGGMHRDSFERVTVQNEREHRVTVERDPAWCESKLDAAEKYDRVQQDIARAAAEVAATVQTMGPKAKREYRKRSAESPKHVTDVTGRP
jgi:hypothetical protein